VSEDPAFHIVLHLTEVSGQSSDDNANI